MGVYLFLEYVVISLLFYLFIRLYDNTSSFLCKLTVPLGLAVDASCYLDIVAFFSVDSNLSFYHSSMDEYCMGTLVQYLNYVMGYRETLM